MIVEKMIALMWVNKSCRKEKGMIQMDKLWSNEKGVIKLEQIYLETFIGQLL